MSLEQAIKDYEKCRLKAGNLPGEAKECEGCPLNKPLHEYEEHPTFCEQLTVINEQYSTYPKSLHSQSPY